MYSVSGVSVIQKPFTEIPVVDIRLKHGLCRFPKHSLVDALKAAASVLQASDISRCSLSCPAAWRSGAAETRSEQVAAKMYDASLTTYWL
jgi:hypothetical protein